MTSHRIGVNLRVSGNCDQGARKYMEDNHVIKFLTKDTDDYELAYFGIFDGHGGPEASAFCRDNLLNEITKYSGFWTDDDNEVLLAIRKGFLDTHNAMWNVLDTWPKTPTGLPSTAGSTATIAIIKQGKLYTGHVGDSGLVLGENDPYGGDNFPYQAVCITKEHKPDDPDERLRIEDAGGEVINKSGVPRVVWSRPKINHKGPVRRSTQIDHIPFLAVARSLGDLWSYDYCKETYVVSPDPDVTVLQLDPSKHRCIILASDGLWNMLTPEETVNIVMDLEAQFEQKVINDPNVAVSFWSNPAEHLVSRALNKWRAKSLKADNTSCVVVLIDPLGPSKLTLLRKQRQALLSGGEITGQLTKMSSLTTEIDHRSKNHNKNANCSLSDSHIRVNDESILKPSLRKEHGVQQGPRPFTVGSGSESMDSREEYINESVQYAPKPAIKWNLRHSFAVDGNQSVSGSGSHANRSSLVSSNDSTHRKSAMTFTSLLDNRKVTENTMKKNCHKSLIEQHANNRHLVDGIFDEFMHGVADVAEDDGESDSDYEKALPKPPPSTPCSGGQEHSRAGENDKEDSLHSSADVTNKAFSLASDESIGSTESSFGSNHPPTPLSAPAKLTGARRSHISKKAKKKLAKSGKKLHSLSKPVSDFIDSVAKSSSTTESGNSRIDRSNGVTKLVNITASAKDVKIQNLKNGSQQATPPRQVLNTSKSMNNVVTPKNLREAARSVSCSGLTPDMNLLMSDIAKSALNIGTSTDLTSHFISTLMAAGLADSETVMRAKREACMIIDDTGVPPASLAQMEPLKQLNKSVTVQKTGSKRWGNFLRASKLGIDQMFQLGSHRKGSADTSQTTSTSKLGCDTSKMMNNRNTSMSTSKLADLSHLHDISQYNGIRLNASTITADDLNNLSALSAEDSMLSADEMSTVHHSMLDTGAADKTGKKRKSFLQKTRVTLRRARKAAKKAFFPENHRLFNKPSGNKRRSDEYLPTPELKRRRQLEGDKSKIS